MQKVLMTSGISLLPPCRTGSDNFVGRIYLIVASYTQKKAHRETQGDIRDLKIFYLPGYIIMMKITLVECNPKIHLVHCYKVTSSNHRGKVVAVCIYGT